MHGFHGALATILYENGHSDSSVALRTGHRDPKSLEYYQHLRGGNGLQQQRDFLGDIETAGSSKSIKIHS